MMSDDVMDFLDCIWEDVREIHELHKGRELIQKPMISPIQPIKCELSDDMLMLPIIQ